jgi:sugar phosphate isomerase/epimerase
MEFGFCCGPEIADVAKRIGYDFCESRVAVLLKPGESEDAFAAALSAVKDAGLACPAVNCFVPGSLKITGAHIDSAALEKHAATTFRRAEQAEVDTIVFGSGGARHIPDGFERDKAHDQIVAFCRMISPIALDHGITIAVEPLNKGACNVLTSVDEAAALVRQVDHPALRLLADSFHMLKDDDPTDSIVTHGDLIKHVHTATYPNGLAPGAEPCDLGPFFHAVVASGYDGRISIEAQSPPSPEQMAAALALMRQLVAAARQGTLL